MRPTHFTLADPTLTHQVVFLVNGGGPVQVTCNCHAVLDHGGWRHVWTKRSSDLDTSRQWYNDPDNHSKPFGPEDRAKW